MSGAVPVAGAGHMWTFAEMSAGAASLASLTGRAVMDWCCAWVVHTCARAQRKIALSEFGGVGCACVCTGCVLIYTACQR